MADRLKIVQLVDFDLQTGKLDTSKLDKEFPKLLQQAFAKLPGTKGLVSPDVEIKPRFNTEKVLKQLNDLPTLLNEKIAKAAQKTGANAVDVKTLKGFDNLEASVTKYSRALDHLNNISTSAKFKPDFLNKVQQISEGSLPSTAVPQRKLQEYRNYLVEVQKTWGQIQREFGKIYDTVARTGDPVNTGGLRNAKSRLRNAQASLMDVETQLQGKDLTNDKFVKLRTRQDELKKKIANEQAAVQGFEEVKSRNIGARVTQEVEDVRRNLGNQVKQLDKALKSYEPDLKQMQRDSDAQFRTKAIERRNKEKLAQPREAQAQLDKLIAGRTPADIAALPGAERVAIDKAITRVMSAIDAVQGRARSLLDDDYKALLQLADEISRQDKIHKQSVLKPLEEKVQRISARRITDNIAPSATETKAIRQELSGFNRQKLEELKTVLANERRLLDQMTKEGKADVDRLKRVVELQARTKEALHTLNAKDKPVSRQAKAEFKSGQAIYKGAGGDISGLSRRELKDVESYLKQAIQVKQALREGEILKASPDQRKIRTLGNEINGLEQSLLHVNSALKQSHPLWHQAGLLISQFMRYAIGYGVLYKLVQGFQDLGRASVNLQDDLKGIQAITGATSDDMLSMKKTIEEVAATSAFKIDDIASAVRTVVQAGVDLQDVPKAVKAVSDLATASGTSLQTAADIITTAQSVWDNLSPDDIANKVTQAANVSKLAVEDLQSIFNYGASFAESANVSLDQYLNAVAALRNAGRKPSTIGTGLSQLLKELFSPDEKFSQFLSDRYAAVGERVSNRQARNRFAAFTETSDPLQAALQELIRIGANTSQATVGLQRSLDQRAFRALSPLLQNPQALVEINARRAVAPTAAEAASIAMESLKKSTGNLRDQLEILADKGIAPLLGPLTTIVEKLTKFAEVLGQNVDKAKNRTGDSGWVASLGSGFAGGMAASRRATGFAKPAAFAAGFIGGATVGYNADRKLAAEGAPDTARQVVDIGIGATLALLPSILKKLFGKVSIDAGSKWVGEIVKSSKGLFGSLMGAVWGAIKTAGALTLARLTPLLAPLAANPITLTVAGIAAVVGAVIGLYKLLKDIPNLIPKGQREEIERLQNDRPKSLEERIERRAERDLKDTQAPTTYARAYPDQPAPADSLEGKVAAQRQEVGSFLSAMRKAFQIPDTQSVDLEQALQLTRDIRDNRGTDAEKAAQRTQAQTLLRGRGPIDEEALQSAQNLATSITTGASALAESLATRYTDLLRKAQRNELTDEELKEFNVFRELETAAPFKALFSSAKSGPRPIIQTLQTVQQVAQAGRLAGLAAPGQVSESAYTDVLDALQLAADARGSEKELNIRALQELLRRETSDRGADFTLRVAEVFSSVLGGHNEDLKEVVAQVIDILIDALQKRVDKRTQDLEAIGTAAGDLGKSGAPVTVTNKDGATITQTGKQFQDLIDTGLPRSLEGLRSVSSELIRAQQIKDPGERFVQFQKAAERARKLLATDQPLSNEDKFLELLRAAEGADYNTIVGGKLKIDDFSTHPNKIGLVTKDGPSTAAGAFQITNSTYRDYVKATGKEGFSPADQRAIARWIIEQEGATEDIRRGDFETAIQKLGGRWASLPSGTSSQAKRSPEWVRRTLAQIEGNPANLLSAGIIETDASGNLSLGSPLQKESNRLAKASTALDEAELRKRLESKDKQIAALQVSIAGLQKGSDSFSGAELAKAREQLVAVQDEREAITQALNKKNSTQADEPIAEELRLNRQDAADKLKLRSAQDLQGFAARQAEIASGKRFLEPLGVTEDELQKYLGRPENLSILTRLEQDRVGQFSDLEKAVKTRLEESRSSYADFKSKGQLEQAVGQLEVSNELELKLDEISKARFASEEKLRDLSLKKAELTKQDLEVSYQQLAATRDALASNGRLNEFTGDLVDVEAKLVEATEKLLQEKVEQGSLTEKGKQAELATLRASLFESSARAEQQDIGSRFRNAQSGVVTFSTGELAAQARQQSLGGAISLQDQRRFALDNYQASYEATQRTAAQLKEALTRRQELEQAGIASGPEYRAILDLIQNSSSSLADFARAVGEATAQLEDLNPTLASEFGQVSGQSIAAKIADLPQALKNLNSNIEDRFVTAVDGFADALFDPVQDLIDSMFGLNQSVDELRNEMKEVGDAQLNLSEVQSRSVDVAQQIEDIRRNESDPARQEYLIQRALQAQQQAEALAQQQVADAQNQYDQAQFEKSGGGKMLNVAKELVSGLAEDVFKGTVLGSFTSLFSDAFGGQPKGTRLDPIYVKMSEDLTQLFSKLFGGTGGTAGNSGGNWLSSIGSLFGGSSGQSGGSGLFGSLSSIGNAFSSFGSMSSTTPGLSANAAFAGPPTASVASGISGASSMGSAVGAIGGLFTIFSNVMQMLQYSTGGAVKIPAYSTGGKITGPGTGTSDSVIAAVSNGEYILNARTTAAIGKETLDAWNFKNQYPMKFSTGGMVAPLQASVQDARAQDIETAVVNNKPDPVTIRPILVDDHRRVEDFLNTPSGERAMVAFVKRNSLSLRQVLQS